MSKYIIGVDYGTDKDYYTIVRRPFWWERLLRKTGLSKATWEWKVVEHGETKHGAIR